MGVAAAAVNSVVTWLLLCQPSALAALPTIKEEARPSSSPSSLAGAAALGHHVPQHASATCDATASHEKRKPIANTTVIA